MTTLFSDYSSGSSPTMLYTLTASETNRTATSVTFSVKVSAILESPAYSNFSALVYPKIKMGGTTKSFDSLGTFPKGASTKSDTISVTVSGISATTSSVSYTFSATTQLGGTSSSSTGYVSGKSGTISISKYATTPSMSGSVTLKDGSKEITSYFREAMGTDTITISWPAQSGGNGTITYELEKQYDGGSWTDVTTTSGRTHDHNQLDAADSLRYRVRAKNTVGGESLYSSWIYSTTVNKNVMKSPSISSSATVNYATHSFTITIKAASDSLGTNMTYSLAGIKNTVLSGSGASEPGTIIIATNFGTSGWYLTLDNLKKAALNGASHSDSHDYKATLDFELTATNAYGTSKTDTVSVTLDLGKDAPIAGDPSVSLVSSSYNLISGANYLFPEYKSLSLNIPANIKDVLGRNCSFDIIMKEGTSEKIIKNTGIISSTTGTVATVNHTEAGLGTIKKNVSFYVKAKTLSGESKASLALPAVDLHYYKKPTVTTKTMSRLQGGVSFSLSITSNSSLGGVANTVTVPTGYAKGTSTKVGTTETLKISNSTPLLDTYTAKISVVIRDSIGYVLADSNDVTFTVAIPKFTPALSIREKGIGINTYATNSEALRVNGNVAVVGNQNVSGELIAGSRLAAEKGYFELGAYDASYGTNKLQTFFDGKTNKWKVQGRDTANNVLGVTLDVNKVNLADSVYFAEGGALNMNNSDIVNANAVVFKDISDNAGEGLLFLKSGRTSGSADKADYDNLFVADGSLSINNGVGEMGLINDLNLSKSLTLGNSYLQKDGNMYYNGTNFRFREAGSWTTLAVQEGFQSGAVTITPSAANTPTSVTIKFSKAFPKAPTIMLTPNTTVPGSTVTGCGVTGVSETGCTIWVTRTNKTDTNIYWQAVLY